MLSSYFKETLLLFHTESTDGELTWVYPTDLPVRLFFVWLIFNVFLDYGRDRLLSFRPTDVEDVRAAFPLLTGVFGGCLRSSRSLSVTAACLISIMVM